MVVYRGMMKCARTHPVPVFVAKMTRVEITREDFKRRTGIEPDPLKVAIIVCRAGGPPIEYVFTDESVVMSEDEQVAELERMWALKDPR